MVKRVPAAYNTPGKSQVVERLRCRAANLRLSKRLEEKVEAAMEWR